MPAMSHLIIQMPQSNGGVALRTRSDDSSDDSSDESTMWWVLSGVLWGTLGGFIILATFHYFRPFGCDCVRNISLVWDKIAR